MILTGPEIKAQVELNRIRISPFCEDRLTTNSYDLALGSTLIRYTSAYLDPFEQPSFQEITIPSSGILLKKGQFILGHSIESFGSDNFVPIIHAKSGVARMGLFVHVTADLIDIGSFGNCTFQLFPTIDVRLYGGMLIGQVSFWEIKGDKKLYNGKYQGSVGPQISKNYLDSRGRK